MLFRPEPKKKKVMADLYRVTPPDQPVFENGNTLCKGKPVAYLIVWKSEKNRKGDRPTHVRAVLVGELGGRLAPQTAYPSPMAKRAFCRQTPEVGA